MGASKASLRIKTSDGRSNYNAKNFEIPSALTYKLDAMLTASKKVGQPQLGRKTILIAGTNGKGSTTALISSLLREHGFRVGTYTSPHVVHRNERIVVAGRKIPESTLIQYEKRYRKVLEPLSYFERLTLIAFLYFRDQKIDVQVLEVGMGGRLDATNISNPDISVVTRIDYDHQDVLGHTLSLIAQEKAGIFRPHGISIVSRQRPSAFKQLKRRAFKLKSKFIHADEQKFSPAVENALKKLGQLQGPHQIENGRASLAAFFSACDLWKFKPVESKVVRALKAKLPLARIQKVGKWIVDGAHNQNSLEALLKTLKTQYGPRHKFHIVFGCMKDKDVAQMIRQLIPWALKVSLPSYYVERELSPHDLRRLWIKLGAKKLGQRQIDVSVIADLDQFLADHRQDRLLVVGSLYLAGAVLGRVEKMK